MVLLFYTKTERGKEAVLDDTTLLTGAKAGNETAFRHLVQKYESLVAATAIGMLGRCPEAEDVGQAVFLNFFNSLNRFRGDSAVGTYLTRITINLCLNELKKRQRRVRWMFWAQEPDPPASNDGADKLESVEREEQVRRAVSRLPPEYRAVVVLRWMDERTTAEIAELLGIPIGTVLSRLHRAHSKLKDWLEPLKGWSP